MAEQFEQFNKFLKAQDGYISEYDIKWKEDANNNLIDKGEINILNPYKKQKLSHSFITYATIFFHLVYCLDRMTIVKVWKIQRS